MARRTSRAGSDEMAPLGAGLYPAKELHVNENLVVYTRYTSLPGAFRSPGKSVR